MAFFQTIAAAVFYSLLLCTLFVDTKKVPKCSICKDIVNNFHKGLTRTAKSNYGGGNTKWEEKSLGSYAFSEVRFVEIGEKLCEDASSECHSMLEEYEDMLETFWFKEYGKKKDTDLYQYLCIDNMKACCPNNTFGKLCKECPGGKDRPCGGNGKCKGEGTREGNGKCACDSGYKGDLCMECKDGFYEESNNETHVVCKVCHIACKDLCHEAGPKGCDECKPGWIENEELGCQDINECADEPCESNKYCTNTQGSYSCFTCDMACETCNGSGSAHCLNCATGYKLNEETGICADVNECEDSSICGEFKQKCENTPGSYFCGCDDGFHMSPEGKCVMVPPPGDDKVGDDEKQEL